mgnify:FL=1
MTVYEFKTSMLTSSGSVNAITLPIRGGLCRYVLIRANTSTTVFRANIQDEDSVRLTDWGFHTGELVENSIAMPMLGRHTLAITNASPDDTFSIRLRVQE